MGFWQEMVALIKRKTPIVTPGPKDKPSTSKPVGLLKINGIIKYQPTDIDKKMQNNGSPKPKFKTDANRNYFLAVFKKHPLSQVEAQVELNETEEKILHLCNVEPKSKSEMAKLFGYDSVPGNIKSSVQKLMKNELLVYTIPEKKTSRKQKYKITKRGLTAISDNG